ncbi:hypothetical protein AAV94_02150 [Lampropedia cohaerens]|uniref:DUF3613 domain-containing protein n=1 Tax=Lampropedia cohaerens TaxID=1610491 RepID=A0A0U1Q2K5_9BURK|nr:DUF3613 domain-containing protein [Lampropedia cohaerens]KKW68982.1 hypothetical protein AAV94_02150 [Lampropedia cohaerens]
MTRIHSILPAAVRGGLAGTVLMVLGHAAVHAQAVDPDHPSTTAAEAAMTHWPAAGDRDYPAGVRQPITRRAPSERTDIGRATDHLLALQRASEGAYPRPIDGEQASRSYARYLKSFETEIPEQFETGIDTGVGD